MRNRTNVSSLTSTGLIIMELYIIWRDDSENKSVFAIFQQSFNFTDFIRSFYTEEPTNQ